ncbi:MAG: aminotransferase class IV [Treponema sp.]|jgi:D-alanine transaminase|nr:aminotransferase class IV [Treponema sp.]
METLGYYNGEIGVLEDMRIPMNDRVCWFGDGVYDATLSANHIIFALEEHIDRFFNSAVLLDMDPPISEPALAELLSSLVRKVDSPSQLVYWQMTRGTASRIHSFPEQAKPNLWVMLRPYSLPDIYRKVGLILLEDTRYLHCNIKTLNLIPNVLAAEKAKQAGAYEAVFHRSERVTECSHSNVHILKNGVFYTPPADHLILPGISRAHLITQCGKLGIPVSETPFAVSQMLAADEILITSSGSFCLSADRINGEPVGGKAPELVRKLQDALLEEFYEATQVKS